MKLWGAIGALSAAAVLAASAEAHEVGLSRGDYVVEGRAVRAQVTLARRELINLVAGLDADADGKLTPAEIAGARDSIEGALVSRLKVSGDGAACPGKLEGAELIEQDGVTVTALYRCDERPRKLAIQLTFLDDLGVGHRHLARATAGSTSIDRLLSARNPRLDLDLAPEATSKVTRTESQPALSSGVGHVLAPPEGPAFLAALLATCQTRRAALVAAAAFASAAAVGLFLGARGLFVPSPRVLGPAVLLSLVYVGLEALVTPRGSRRWRVALPFGVVYGLAGAAAFRGLPGAPGASVFAAGVALALAGVTAALLAAAALARRWPALQTRGVGALGAAIAAVGLTGLVMALA